MKKRFLTALSVVLTAALTVGLIQWLGFLVRPCDLDDTRNAVKTFQQLEPDSLDVIAFGSSHTWYGFDPSVMREKYGIRAYNFGCYYQKLNTTYLFLTEALRTQKPKTVLIDTFYVNRQNAELNGINGELYSTRKLSASPEKREYVAQCLGGDPTLYLSYYIPLFAFHENWVNIGRNSFFPSYTVDFEATFGFVPNSRTTAVTIPVQTGGSQKELSEAAKETLGKITGICREKQINVVFYTAPWDGIFEYSDAVSEYAKANGHYYINMFECKGTDAFDPQTDFADNGHLNSTGAAKAADILGKFITEKGLV